MKKLVGFIIILGLVLMLAACVSVQQAPSDEAEEPQIFAAQDKEAPTEYEEPEVVTPGEVDKEPHIMKKLDVQIALAYEGRPLRSSPGDVHSVYRHPAGWQNEILSTFTCLYELDHLIVREAAGTGRVYVEGGVELVGNGIVIWSDERMRDFRMVLLDLAYAHTNEEQRDLIFIPHSSFGFVEEIQPGQAFLINSYVEMGEVFPAVAITFVDENDNIRYFSILLSLSDGGDPYLMWEMEDRANELAGAKISFDRENYRPDGWVPGGPYLSDL